MSETLYSGRCKAEPVDAKIIWTEHLHHLLGAVHSRIAINTGLQPEPSINATEETLKIAINLYVRQLHQETARRTLCL